MSDHSRSGNSHYFTNLSTVNRFVLAICNHTHAPQILLNLQSTRHTNLNAIYNSLQRRDSFMNLILIMAGGFIGASFRYLISLYIPFGGDLFPYATFGTNLLGCFILGFLSSSIIRTSKTGAHLYLFLGTGIIGSFTTFSTFSVETIWLVQNNLFGIAVVYVLLSIFLGLLMSFFGHIVARPRNLNGDLS